MSNYEEINARLLAERDARKPPPPPTDEEILEMLPGLLDTIERLAAEFHRLWEARGFDKGRWLQVEGTEKLARMISFPSTPEDPDFSDINVMIDGRLMYYRDFTHHHYQRPINGKIMPSRTCREKHFDAYRDYVAREVECGDTYVPRNVLKDIQRLDYMIQNI